MVLVTVAPLPGESVLEVAGVAWFREWWDAHRPGWVDPSWWSMPVRHDVAPLLSLPAGPDLLTKLHGLDAARCPDRHDGEGVPGDPAPGSAPGFPCGCQVVLVAAWRAVTGWTAARSAQALAGAVGREPVALRADGARPGIVDPAREEVAVALRLAPGSAASAMRRARALAAFPRLRRWPAMGFCHWSRWSGSASPLPGCPAETPSASWPSGAGGSASGCAAGGR